MTTKSEISAELRPELCRYREAYWDPTGEDTDVMIAHANGDAIREANAAKVLTSEPTEEMINDIDFSSAPGMQEEEEEDETVEETVDEVDEDDDIDDVEDEVEEFEEEDFEL